MDEDEQKELIKILKNVQLSFSIIGEEQPIDEDDRNNLLTILCDLKKNLLIQIIKEVLTNPQTQPYKLEENLQLCNDLIRRTREQRSSTSTAGGASSSHATSRVSSSGTADIGSTRHSSSVAGIGGSSDVTSVCPSEDLIRRTSGQRTSTSTGGGASISHATSRASSSGIADIRSTRRSSSVAGIGGSSDVASVCPFEDLIRRTSGQRTSTSAAGGASSSHATSRASSSGIADIGSTRRSNSVAGIGGSSDVTSVCRSKDLIRRTSGQRTSTSTARGASSSHATSRASSSGITDIGSTRRSSSAAGIGGSSDVASVEVGNRGIKLRVEGCFSCIQPRQDSIAESSRQSTENVENATVTAEGIWVFRGTDEEFKSIIAGIRNLFGEEAVLCALAVVNGNDDDFEYIVEDVPKFVDPSSSAEHEEFEDIIADIRTLFEDEPVVYGFITFPGTDENFKDIIARLRNFYKEEPLVCLLAVFKEDDEEEFKRFTEDLRISPKKEDEESTFEDLMRENRFVHYREPGLVCVEELDEKILRVRSYSSIGDWLSKYSHLLDCYDEYDAFKGLNGSNNVVEKEFEASKAAIEAFKSQKKRDQSARLQGLKRKFNMMMNVCKKRTLKSKEQSGEEKFEPLKL